VGIPAEVTGNNAMTGIGKRNYELAMICLMLSLPAFVCSSLPAQEKEKPLKVFILAGQSNMLGKAKVGELPDELKAEQPKVLYSLNGKGWTPLCPPKKDDATVGPEISFGKEMSSKLNEPIGIIKQAIGGTNLAKDWDPNDPKYLYSNLLAKVVAAKQTRPVEIVGMCWLQGENDAKHEEMANAYGDNLAKFILRARKDFDSPNMFFVAGRVNPAYPYVNAVRLAQEKCQVPGYAFVDCDKLPKLQDNLHYDTKGVVELGTKFADAMLDLMKPKVPEKAAK
jgi:hypothetical protein